MASPITAVGTRVIQFLIYMGEVVVLAGETFASIATQKIRWRIFMSQIVEIGLRSQSVVVITGAFTGAVFAAQTYFQFNKLGMGSAVGAVVSVAICRELGPVLTALMVTGRVGASMSAEIGTMKVTEQIDALRALAVHPVDYLVVPRALAMMVSMPLLVAECIGVGIVAGYFVAIGLLEINGTYYVANMVRWTQGRDIIMGLTKAFSFALLIVFISCHKGLTSREGAVG
ncbi:MAG: MlaE family ABC transporter permease, partial [Chthoniobacterales bacterium]